MIFALGATSQSVDIQVVDDEGLPVTGLVAATFPALSYSLAGAHASVSITLSDLALITTAWASGGVKERSGGRYRLDVPNAAYATAGNVQVFGEDTDKRVIVPVFEVGSVPTLAQIVATSIAVTPISNTLGERVQQTEIQAFYEEEGWTIGPVVVVDANDDPVDLTAYTSLKLVIEDQHRTDIMTTTAITISGADDNQWSAVGTAAITAAAPLKLRWALRGISTGVNEVLGHGELQVTYAAAEDPEEEE